jgi:hypothetical protein
MMTLKLFPTTLLVVLLFSGCQAEPEVSRAPAGTEPGVSAPGSRTGGPQTKRPLKIAD